MTDIPWAKITLVEDENQLKFFDCGFNKVNEWAQSHGYAQNVSGRIRTWLCLSNANEVVGFFALKTIPLTLKSETNRLKSLAEGTSSSVLLAQMGLQKEHRGNGLGTHLVVEALRKALEADKQSAVGSVTVDAATPELVPFYQENGFTLTRTEENRLVMKMSRVRKMVAAYNETRDERL